MQNKDHKLAPPAALTRRSALLQASSGLLLTATRAAVPGALLAGQCADAQTSLSEQGTQLLLLGTQGGPNFNETRGECASALIVDGEIYLFDCGYGAMLSLRKSGLHHREVGHIFVTHLHDDHVGDLATLLSHQWTDGRVDPTQVIGPYGTQSMVAGALEFARANAIIRLIDEDRSVQPEDIITARDIEAPAEPSVVYSDERVQVSAVENTHFPEDAKAQMPYRAVSYRVDTADRSVVFSGDTAYSAGLVELARDANLFVCETIQVSTARANFERRVAAGSYADNPEGVWAHIVGTHASTEDTGRMAAEANVSTLVLTHLIPGSLVEIDDDVYLEGIRQHFDGDVIIGEDGLVI